MKEKINKTVIDRLAEGKLGADAIVTDTEVRGFRARRLPSGAVRFSLRFYNAQGRRRELDLGMYGTVAADVARTLAKKRAGEVADGRDVFEEKTEVKKRTGKTVNAVLDDFEIQHLPGLSSADEVKRCFRVDVRPALGSVNIYDIKRGHIVKLLDGIAVKRKAPVQADRVLAHLRKALNWYAARDDKFNSPIVKGMARTKPSQRARKRILDDREIRDLWLALDELQDDAGAPACFAGFVRTLFLTATRLRMVSNMRRDEIEGREWLIPAKRNKGGLEHLVPLTDGVVELVKTDDAPFVFSSDGGETAFKGFSKAKVALDAKLAEIRKRDGRKPMDHWTFHDLRRTARSLMSRAGIPTDHAERALGHVMGGVRGTYDRHHYKKEKMQALQALAVLVNRILRSEGGKVVAFRKRG